MSKSTLTVSIGRNVPNNKVITLSPSIVARFDAYVGAWMLDELDWLSFQESVESIFRNGKAETRALGVSVWDSVEEDTCVFQWFNAPLPTESELAELRKLADKYGQESIAVTYAAPKFI